MKIKIYSFTSGIKSRCRGSLINLGETKFVLQYTAGIPDIDLVVLWEQLREAKLVWPNGVNESYHRAHKLGNRLGHELYFLECGLSEAEFMRRKSELDKFVKKIGTKFNKKINDECQTVTLS